MQFVKFLQWHEDPIHLVRGFVKKEEFSTDFAEFMTMVKKTNNS
jgi:hypothetical protein